MIATDPQARQLVCPLISSGQGKRIRCVGAECAWWRWQAGPGVAFDQHCTGTTERVGGCGALGAPSSQHLLLAMGKQRPRTATAFGIEQFDAARLNPVAPNATPDDVF